MHRLALIPLAFACHAALAHDTWIASTPRTVQAGAPLSFDMTSADHFPKPGTAIAQERIAQSACRQAGTGVALRPGDKTRAVLRLAATPPAAGAVTCWVMLKPRSLELAPDIVEAYLDEIDAPASVRQTWQSGPRLWKETYTKNAKAMVPGIAADAQVAVPVGLKLEFVLQADPSAGASPLDVLVLRDGKPLPGLSVALSGEAGAKPQRARSDAAGIARFSPPPAGRWMLSATELWPADAGKGVWESQFTTLIFEAGARR